LAAGPVGRRAGASTDLKLNAQIFSYSRSTGPFAGLELKGVVIKPDKDDMRDMYGDGVTAKEVLKENKVIAPVGAHFSDFAWTVLFAQSCRTLCLRTDIRSCSKVNRLASPLLLR
jgi:hypothetical protein